MLRTSAIALGSLVIGCASAHAQGVRTPERIVSPIKDGGTLDWATGTWRNSTGFLANAPGASVVFDNTCGFSGGMSYSPLGNCWDQYEEGRLPTGDPADPFSADIIANGDPNQVCNAYFLCAFEFGYCSNEDVNAGGNVQIQIGLLEGPNVSGIGGACMNSLGALATPVPPSGAPAGLALPPGNFGGPNDLFLDITGLPGSSTPQGNASCWLITIDLSNNANGGFAFAGDGGDSMYQGDGTDVFNWLWSQRGTTELGATATGPFLGGDFSVAGGAGAFGIPQGTPAGGGPACGTGLDISDGQWLNQDGHPVGSSSLGSACQPLPGALALGSNCYFFGGWPGNPVADTYLTLWASGCLLDPVDPQTVIPYCTAKASASGCLASLSGSGGQAVSGANDWSIIMSGAQGNRPGIFFGGLAQAAIPFQGGFLCVLPPLKRSIIQFSFGTPGACDGSFSLLINDGALLPPPLAGSGFDAGPGGTSFMQAWYREPALMDGFDTALSNALQIIWM